MGCRLPLDGFILSAHLEPWKLFQADIARLSKKSWERFSKLMGATATPEGRRASEKQGLSVAGIFFRGTVSVPSYLRKGSG